LKTGREEALHILSEINQKGAYSTLAIKKNLEMESQRKDANFIRELVYGVLENKRLIDKIIEESSSVKLRKIHPMILEIIRIGVYQLLFLDHIPESAAVNESVKLAKAYGHKGTIGYVNGVLRGIAAKKSYYKSIEFMSGEEMVAVKFSHPDFMVDIWVEQYGIDFTKKLLTANNSVPPFTIRVNTLKCKVEELRSLLLSKGIQAVKGQLAEDSLIIRNPHEIISTEEYNNGLFTIQDEASMMVTEAMNPEIGSVVLDVCAAPGGKSTHIAQWMNDEGIVISRDIYPHKIILINHIKDRLGISSIDAQLHDAFVFDNELEGKVDYCLVDAPCSGLGLIRRKPDIKWTRTVDELKALSQMQNKMIQTASSYLKVGGVLLYSTCTLNNQENLGVIRNFLNNDSRFKLTPIEFNSGKVVSETQEYGYLELYPHIHDSDGFFIARMQRIN
jgi:16S rRNA (cytosine967-C5)-methyltransferase